MNSRKVKEVELEMLQLSMQLRKDLTLPASDALNTEKVLQSKHILAVLKPLEDTFSGMAVMASDAKGNPIRCMLVNTAQSLGKQRFTICHELYHLLYQCGFSYSVNNAGTFNEADLEEYKADVFASFLLLPKESMESMLPTQVLLQKRRISLADILAVEQNYQCSRIVVLRRLKSMGIISGLEFDVFSRNVTRSAMEFGYNTQLYKPTGKIEVIGDYNLKARKLYSEGRISMSRYMELIREMGIYNNEEENDTEGDIA